MEISMLSGIVSFLQKKTILERNKSDIGFSKNIYIFESNKSHIGFSRIKMINVL